EEGALMQASMFNVRVPLDSAATGGDVFLMNTFTDAQLIVSRDVAALLDRVGGEGDLAAFSGGEREAGRAGLPRPRPPIGAAGPRALLPRRPGKPRPARRHRADDVAVQFRVRLLLSGRSRRLQQ